MTTRLEIVQDILSDADGDEVTSVSDTVEAEQVDRLVFTAYDTIVDQYDLPYTMQLWTQANSVEGSTRFTIPTEVNRIEWLKYDKSTDAAKPDFQIITFMEPAEFFDLVHSRDKSASNTTTNTFQSVEYYVYNDRMPSYWTTTDDQVIIFDSFDSAVDTNGLVPAKIYGYGLQRPSLPADENDTITLPEELWGLLRDEVREMYWDFFRDGATPKVNQLARRSRVRSQRNKHKFKLRQPREDKRPDYGRKGPRTRNKNWEGITGTGGTQLPDWWPS